MKSLSFVLASSASALLLLLITGCEITSGLNAPCENREPGELKCSSVGGGEILVCSNDKVWVTHQDCSADDKSCVIADSSYQCRCATGETRCVASDTAVEVCNDGGDWEASETCEEGEICELRNGVAACGPETCTPGETRCSADNRQVEICSDDEWKPSLTCEQDQICVLEGSTATCIVDEEPCGAGNLFAQRCSPDDELWIQECRNTGTEQAPVYEWVDSQDCSLQTPDYVCIQEMGTLPYCFAPPG